jgi:hypothetical protein
MEATSLIHESQLRNPTNTQVNKYAFLHYVRMGKKKGEEK